MIIVYHNINSSNNKKNMTLNQSETMNAKNSFVECE